MFGKPYETIYLNFTSHPITIPRETFAQIAALIQAVRICQFCQQAYTGPNPMVAENTCLDCFVPHRDSPPKDISFVGEHPSTHAQERGYNVFLFVDRQGYIYFCRNNDDHQQNLQCSLAETLLHHGFPCPTSFTHKGNTVQLDPHAFRQIYGQFTERSTPVVLVTYYEHYGQRIDTAFLLYRDGSTVEFSKRKGEMRRWYQEAKAELEQKYVPHIGYVVGVSSDGEPYTTYHIEDHHIYPGIVQKAAEQCQLL